MIILNEDRELKEFEDFINACANAVVILRECGVQNFSIPCKKNGIRYISLTEFDNLVNKYGELIDGE